MEITKADRKFYLSLPGRSRPLELNRVWGALVWPEEQPGYLLVGAQAKADGKLFLATEHETTDWQDLARAAAAAVKAHQVSRLLHHGGPVAEAFRERAQRLVREEGLTGFDPAGRRLSLPITDAPHPDAPMYAAGVAKAWLEASRVITAGRLPVYTSQLAAAGSLRPDGVIEAMHGELYAFRALVMLISGLDLWRMEKVTATTPVAEPRDERTGI